MHGRRALVTGVSRRQGIGYAIARRLIEAGAQVVVHGWTPHDAAQEWGADDLSVAEVAASLGAAGHVEADFSDADAPQRVVAVAAQTLGGLDILVLNHARSGDGTLHELTAETIDPFLHENVRASLLLVKEFAAQFEGDAGRVVLLTSGQELGPMRGEVAYAVSKGALAAALPTLADELADQGITVNAVNPGPTDTGWGLAEFDPGKRMPFGRWGEPDDAARLIAWLCSDDAKWITGQLINSEGGFRRFG